MKKIALRLLLLIGVYGLAAKSFAQNSSDGKRTIYIVRHAEKDTGSNPALTIAGQKRAGDLYRLLKDNKIDLIFTSNYKRTVMTGDSLRITNNIDTVYYIPDITGEKLFQKIAERAGDAKNILIIGHSNTLPGIIRKAGVVEYTIKELPETEYDNFFIVEQKEGKVEFKQKKYGNPSPKPAGSSTMQMQ